MTITSYAQNFEDVILYRALKHVENGFYIDIGAQDPVHDSVSLAFYERGWRGVHVEPSASFADRLRAARPEEEVIEAAVGGVDGEIRFFEIAETGLSTGDERIAEQHEQRGYNVNSTLVPCRPLSAILDAYKDREIHWLKIDVEGMEGDVIDSWRPSNVRPWIVVVESTRPTTADPSYTEWESRLLAHGYEFVYSDGLNRFFVRDDQLDIKASFGPGPNIFDGFRLHRSSIFAPEPALEEEAAKLAAERDLKITLKQKVSAERRAKTVAEDKLSAERDLRITLEQQILAERRAKTAAEHRLSAALEAKQAAEQRVNGLRERADHASEELRRVYESRSWRLTAGYRAFGRWLRGARWWLGSFIKARTVRPIVRRCALWGLAVTRRYPFAKRLALKGIELFPTVSRRLALFAAHNPPTRQSLPAEAAYEKLVSAPRRLQKLHDSRLADVLSQIRQ